MDVNCIILAGGKSVRLGRNKLLEKIGEQNLLERVINRLAYFKSEIIVVAAHDSTLPELAGYPGLKVINDIMPGKGSLGGLYSGLTVSERQYNLVAAGDMPFINLELFKHMISLAENYDAVVPLLNDKAEPLHAVYSRKCITAIKDLIEQNRLSISNIFPMVNAHFINTTDIEKFDPKHLSFFNINTEVDLKNGKEIAERGDL